MNLPYSEFSDYQEFNAKTKTNRFPIEFNCTGLRFSIENFIEGLKPVVMKKYEFDHRDKSVFLDLFGIHGLSAFASKDQNVRI